MTDAEPAPKPDPPPEPTPAPQKGDTQVVGEQLQEFDGKQWVKFQYLPSAGSGGDGKPVVIYKFIGDFEVDG